jgi:hypothetical protein
MSSSDNEQANELVEARTPADGQRRIYQKIVGPAFFVVVVVAMAGWLYLLGELVAMIFEWLFR